MKPALNVNMKTYPLWLADLPLRHVIDKLVVTVGVDIPRRRITVRARLPFRYDASVELITLALRASTTEVLGSVWKFGIFG